MMDDPFGLKGKTALILGAGQGIGEATALMMAAHGCRIVCVDVEDARAQAIAERIRRTGVDACPLVANILEDDQLERVMAEAEAAFGGLDILVTVVGSTAFRPLLETTGEQWDMEQRINIRYVFLAARAFAARREQDGRGGAITVVASVSGVMAAPRHAPYGAAKAGLIHLVKSMATEWAPLGIRVNAVAPGSIITPRLPDTAEWRDQIARSAHPMQRRGQVEEIAGPVVFLSSPLASYVTGQMLAADGGLTIANIMAVPPRLKDARTGDHAEA